MEIGRKIKVLRVEKGISQKDLAKAINKTRALISHIEVTSKVNYFTLTEIASALDVPISYFVEDISSVKAEVKESDSKYLSFSEENKKLKRENELLNEIISNQKEIIKQLKEKLKNS